MRIATWNVNSLKARLPRVEEWLEYADARRAVPPGDEALRQGVPALTFSALGYDSVHHGQGQWNGVAILSRVGIADVDAAASATSPDPYEGDARLLAATCDGVRVVSVYVPNGREVGTEHYDRKLEWLAQLRTWLDTTASPLGRRSRSSATSTWHPRIATCGRSKAFEGSTHVTEPERAAVRALEDWGMVDAFRARYDEDHLYTYWDYRRGDFHQHRGMRIDLALVTTPLADTARSSRSSIATRARASSRPTTRRCSSTSRART